jgi:hypothetical protein
MTIEQLFAEACPEEISITETYRCTQSIAQNSSRGMAEEPARGEIRVVVPYDGGESFSAAALRSVEDRLTQWGARDERIEAQIGHLLFDGTEGSDLDRILATANRFGAVPLLIPVSSPEIDGPSLLWSDSQAASLVADYTPKPPEIPPVDVEMELTDADAMNSEWLAVRAWRERLNLDEAKRLARARPERRRALLLRVDVRFELPSRVPREAHCSSAEVEDEPEPEVTAQIELRWPAIPSPGSVTLYRPALDHEKAESGTKVAEDVIYDPASRTLRCRSWKLVRKKSENQGDLAIFKSDTIYLAISHGEDLYGETLLQGRVEIEVTGRLLSGLRVVAFGPTGGRTIRDVTSCKTRVLTDVTLDLDEAVRKWIRSPVQELHFDHVILDELRLRDVRTALLDRGFEVDRDLFNGDLPAGLLEAHRSEGAEALLLWVYLEGEHYMTRRTTEVPGGQTFTTRVKSGRLTAYVWGLLKGAGGPVLEEIHYLHERLRHQFLATTDRR